MPSRLLAKPGRHTTAFYMVFFLVNGVHMPFWPLWLADWGLAAAEIGIFTALGMGVRVLAGLVIPALADRLDARRHTIAVCAAACIVLFIAHLWIGNKIVLLLATLAVGAAMAGMGPIAEALGTAAARFHGFAYAQARGFGSLGFLFANVVIGAMMVRFGANVALWTIVVGLTGVLVLVAHHPGGRKVQGQIPPNLGEIGRLIVHPIFALFVATVAFIQASHAVFYAFGSIHWRELGVGEARIGALWAAAVGAEIVFMVTIGTWAVQRLGPVRAMALSGLAGTMRWGAMAFDPAGWLLWPLQSLHAVTFALGHLGAMAFVTRAIPPRFGAAAQGAMGSMAVGLVMALAMALASAVYPTLGGRTYAIGFGLSALGVALAWLLSRRWRGQKLAV